MCNSYHKDTIFTITTFIAFALLVLGCEFAGFLDMPNHMARAFVLKECLLGSGASEACSNFSYSFSLFPFMLADLVLVGFLSLASVFVAEKLAVVFLIGLLIFSWNRLYLAVHGRVSWPWLLAVPMFYSNFLFNGFYAYLLSLALCMFGSVFGTLREIAKA